MNLFIKTRLSCALALFLAFAIRDANGQEQAFAAGNCALTPPAGWQRREIKNQPGLIAAYGDPEGTRTLLIIADQRGKVGHVFNEASVVDFDKGVENAGGGPKTSGKFVKFAGFDAYERVGTAVVKGKHMSTLVMAIPTGDGLYALEALGTKAEVTNDEQIRQAINSFCFLQRPGPPRQPPDAAYRAGYLVGQLLMGIVVLSVIVWIVTRVVSRRNPPMPTGFSGPYPYPQAGFPPLPVAPPPFPPVAPRIPPPLPPIS